MTWEGGERTPGRGVRPPLLVIGVVLAVVVVGLAVREGAAPEPPQLTVEPSPSPSRSPSPEPEPAPSPRPAPSAGEVERGQIEPLLLGRTGLTLHALDQAGRLARIDLDTGDLAEIGLFRATSEQPQLVPDGAGGVLVVTVNYDPARPQQDALHVAALDQPPVPLGPAAGALASATPGRVWLLDQPAGFPGTANRVREVAYDGTVVVDATLPAGVTVRSAAPEGLLVEAAGTLVRWDPRAGRGRPAGEGSFVAGNPRVLVRRICDVQLRCWLTSPEAVRAELREPAALALTEAFGLARTISPDGRLIALVASDSRVDFRFGFEPRAALLDLANGELRWAPETFGAGDFFPQSLEWAPSGDWVFAGSGQDVLAWNVTDDRVVTIDLLGGRLAAIAVQ